MKIVGRPKKFKVSQMHKDHAQTRNKLSLYGPRQANLVLIAYIVKRICVFEHSIMTNFNCTCPAIQRGQRSGFLSEGSSWLTACIGDKYQIDLTRSILIGIFVILQRSSTFTSL